MFNITLFYSIGLSNGGIRNFSSSASLFYRKKNQDVQSVVTIVNPGTDRINAYKANPELYKDNPFYADIKNGVWKGSKDRFYVFFNFIDLFDSSLFRSRLHASKDFQTGFRYFVLVSVKYGDGSWLMAGQQFVHTHGTGTLDMLQDALRGKVLYSLNSYTITSDAVSYIKVTFNAIDVSLKSRYRMTKGKETPELKAYIRTHFGGIPIVPISTKALQLGIALESKVGAEGVVKEVLLIYKGVSYNMVDIINKVNRNKILKVRMSFVYLILMVEIMS